MYTAVVSCLNICIPLSEKCIEAPANHSLFHFYSKKCNEGSIVGEQRSWVNILSYLLLQYFSLIDGGNLMI